MPEKETFEYISSTPSEKEVEISNQEKEITKEKIESLPDWEEPGSFYRGVKVEEALRAILGDVKLDANPKDEALKTRDNASLNLHEAIYFADSSETKKGRKFLCAIGFDTLPGALVESSCLGKSTFARISGPIKATEVVVRFAGEKPGNPAKKVKYFSPKEFYFWYQKNCVEINK